MEPVIMKLYDLVSQCGKKQVLALPSTGKLGVRASYGNKKIKDTWHHVCYQFDNMDTCNQCYKRFTDMYFSIITPCAVKFNMMILVFTFKNQVLQQKSMIILKYTTLVATNDFKNRPVFTNL